MNLPLRLVVGGLTSGGGLEAKWWTYWGITSARGGAEPLQSQSSWMKHRPVSRICQERCPVKIQQPTGPDRTGPERSGVSGTDQNNSPDWSSFSLTDECSGIHLWITHSSSSQPQDWSDVAPHTSPSCCVCPPAHTPHSIGIFLSLSGRPEHTTHTMRSVGLNFSHTVVTNILWSQWKSTSSLLVNSFSFTPGVKGWQTNS